MSLRIKNPFSICQPTKRWQFITFVVKPHKKLIQEGIDQRKTANNSATQTGTGSNQREQRKDKGGMMGQRQRLRVNRADPEFHNISKFFP